MTVRKGCIPLVDPQSFDAATLLAAAALTLLLATLGWYAYARGTRHGDDEPPTA